MDTLNHYRGLVEDIIGHYANRKPANRPDVEYQLAIDEKRLQFILLAVGWHEDEFVHNWIFHVRLKGGKIWVYEDRTDPGIKVLLMEKGVRESDIVLGFMPEYEKGPFPQVTAG